MRLRAARGPTSTREAAAFIAGARAVPLAVSLVVTPYVVSTIGLQAYGFWAITGGLTAWVALMDVGIGDAVQQRVAATTASTREVGRCLGTASVIAGVLAALAAGIVLVAIVALPSEWTDSLPAGWQPTVALSGVAVSVTFLSSVPLGLLKGRERWRMYSLSLTAGQLLFSVATVVLLALGAGLPGLAGALLASSVCGFLLAVTLAAVSEGAALRTMSVDRALVGPLLRYGGNVQVSNLVQVANTQTDKLILTLFAPLAWIGLFELGARLALNLRWLPLSVFPPLVSRAATGYDESDPAAMRRFYERQLRQTYRFLVCPLIAALPLVYAFMFLWLGDGFEVSAAVAVLLTLGYSLNLLTGAGTSVARGAGRPSLDRNYCLLGFAINIVATVAFGVVWGGWGVIAATVLGLVVSSFVLLVWVDRWLGSSGASCGWTGYTWPARVELPALIAGAMVAVGFAHLVVTDRASALVFFALAAAVTAVGYLIYRLLRRSRRRSLLQPSEGSR